MQSQNSFESWMTPELGESFLQRFGEIVNAVEYLAAIADDERTAHQAITPPQLLEQAGTLGLATTIETPAIEQPGLHMITANTPEVVQAPTSLAPVLPMHQQQMADEARKIIEAEAA